MSPKEFMDSKLLFGRVYDGQGKVFNITRCCTSTDSFIAIID